MMYDEHRKRGMEDATSGAPRYRWSDPHLQKAYDEGYRAAIEGHACLYCGRSGKHDCEHQRMLRRDRQLAGFPGRTRIVDDDD